MKSKPNITVQFASARRGVPHPLSLRRWALAALKSARYKYDGAICIRIVGAKESRTLNAKWRAKDKPTNVLSFPYAKGGLSKDTPALLGDLVICATVVAKEARDQGKTATAHWAHMVIHGVLHLLGYDHEKSRDALQMEALEVEILQGLGLPDPYHELR